ncbi:MAG: chromosome segregation SMC family protein [Actinomycetota bacterium]
MFLRSLTLRGFKSFAEKTTLEFAPGISVIVGPNGSGKSNLVDAISWVLGEQGPRALRGGAMADVIFAGSPARPGLGMAEVHLVIDNSAGIIPVPLTEIEISRTIFRAGDNEYRIGGQVCRLLDIQELLAETGIGRALHTVVGQGNLEDVLTARPEERRQYIEEAAGISKHLRRKQRAERKLAGMEQDVLRLQDVLTELRRQLRPLKQQAEMAKRHETLTAQADELSWRIAASRLRDLVGNRDAKTAGWEEGLAKRQAAKQRLETLDRDIERLTGARAEVTRGVAETQERHQIAELEKLEAERALRETVQQESDARARQVASEAGSARLIALRAEITRAEVALRETGSALVDREQELDEAERLFRERERARLDAEEERRQFAEEAATHRAEVETLRRSLDSQERERIHVTESLEAVRTSIREAGEERETLERKIETLDAEETPLAERQTRLEAERNALLGDISELDERLRELEVRHEVASKRLATVSQTAGTRFIAKHGDRAVGLLRDLIAPEPGLERALAAVLGPLADAVVYEEVSAAIEDVRSGEGATLAVTREAEERRPSLMEPLLIAALKPDPRVRGLVATLLQEVYVAADAAGAARSHADHPEATFVTRDGVCIGPAIVRTDAVPDDGVRALRSEVRALDGEIASTRAALVPKRTKLDTLTAEAARLVEALEHADAGITVAAERLDRLGRDVESMAKEEDLLSERLARLDESAATWRESLGAPRTGAHDLPALPPHPEPPLTLRVEVETLRRERQRLESTLARLREEWGDIGTAEPGDLELGVRDAEAKRGAADERLAGAEQALTEAMGARDVAVEADRVAALAEAEANRGWREVAAELDRLRETYEEEDRLRGELTRRIDDAERLLREGHEMDPEQALAALTDEDDVDALTRKAELVSRRLGLLGRVNLLAEGEFGALQERHDFLARELDDVRKARRDLLEVIRQVDEEVVTLFDGAFRDVSTEFESLFSELFPGGEGKLLLTDPADLLHTGVEIEARPGRKRVKRISLLSGGERALTALGFLFAIFRARPSPFYLLDEVEAALDDVNLHRFLGLIKGFASTSQVLVVTHQKRTMEAGDMLYGVSMNRDGSSTVVSQRLEDIPDEVIEVPDAETV